jgi:hypothetical protein
LLALDLYKVGVDIVVNLIFILLFPQKDSGLLEGHELMVAVELELLGMFVEFVDVFTSLCHKGY